MDQKIQSASSIFHPRLTHAKVKHLIQSTEVAGLRSQTLVNFFGPQSGNFI